MKVHLELNDRGEWQADVVLPDGRDFHAVGRHPGEALVELGDYWLKQPATRDPDLVTLVQVVSRA